jgi:hypothetical protein
MLDWYDRDCTGHEVIRRCERRPTWTMASDGHQAATSQSFADNGRGTLENLRCDEKCAPTADLPRTTHRCTRNRPELRERFPSKEGETVPVVLRIRFPMVPGTESTPLNRGKVFLHRLGSRSVPEVPKMTVPGTAPGTRNWRPHWLDLRYLRAARTTVFRLPFADDRSARMAVSTVASRGTARSSRAIAVSDVPAGHVSADMTCGVGAPRSVL